jgi:hypothetical protein
VDELIDAYVAELPADRADAIRTVDRLIRDELPHLEVKLWGKIIGYGSYHYRYASGREGDWFPIGLANQKQYVSLYVCLVDDGEYLAEARKDRLATAPGKVKVGRSCITFKKIEHLDLDETAAMLRRVNELLAGGAAVFGQ